MPRKKKIRERKLAIAYSEAYDKLHERDDLSIPYYMDRIKAAYNDGDLYLLQNIFDELHDPKEEIVLNSYKAEIVEKIGCPPDEIKDALDAIKTPEEADNVLAAVESSDHLTNFEKGYAAAKKKRARKRKMKIEIPTYEHGVRMNRRILENYLYEIGVGRNRAKKISSILYSI